MVGPSRFSLIQREKKEDQDYKYEDSQIVRFPVYVETDYDTDADGKPDLVKAIVQLPKAVAQGDFKAATILEARPYVAGTLDENYVTLESLGLPTDGSYDMKKLHSQPAKRQPVSSETTVEAAKKAKASDWYYYSPYEYIYDYEDLNWYDYFLVRGYAFISSAGLGTKGSEGLTQRDPISKSMPSRISSNGSMANAKPTPIRLTISK